MRVVLAEEDAGMRAFIRSMLADGVSTVIEVAGAWDCLAITTATDPDIVLLGAIDLRDERGRELPTLLRRSRPTARLLVLGARAPSARRGPCLDVDGHLPYPFRAQDLLQAMMDCLAAGLPWTPDGQKPLKRQR